MDSKHFWELIEESNREATGDPTNQAAILARTLAAYSTDQIIEFETFFVEYLSRAYDARLMAASAIIVEDMDDDDFLDFRLWLISQGRSAYERSLDNPDALSDLVEHGDRVKAPEMGRVAHEAYLEKTGRDELDCLYADPPSPELKNGTLVWQTREGYLDVNLLRGLFPGLWAKFGERFDSE